MEKCSICNNTKDVKMMWNIPKFKYGLISVNAGNDPFENNMICENCAQELLCKGRIRGKEGFGYRFMC